MHRVYKETSVEAITAAIIFTIRTTINHTHTLLIMACDHPKKALSSSKNESNNDDSLSTRKSEIALL